jgi:hypothetical protein
MAPLNADQCKLGIFGDVSSGNTLPLQLIIDIEMPITEMSSISTGGAAMNAIM